ncbi:MAG: HAMP domain-containing histidine kinase [Gemmatimonadaceae bacterium]|nr:HAMP domain-containing histidine kinase [Gemmatimonadaceae bacterium]
MDDSTHALLAGLAHELRTPLAAIGGHAELLRVGVHGPILPKQLESLERIRMNHLRMAAMITELMEYAEAARGTRRMFLEEAEVARLIEHAIGALSVSASERNVTVSFGMPCDDDEAADAQTSFCPVMVFADKMALSEVLQAILRDSVESHGGGHVTVRLSSVGDSAVVTIETDEAPFAETECEAVFVPFDREARGQRVNGQSALVLPRARLLARAFGGDVRAVPTTDRRVIAIHLARMVERTSGV